MAASPFSVRYDILRDISLNRTLRRVARWIVVPNHANLRQ
jgi:hypothetical protein